MKRRQFVVAAGATATAAVAGCLGGDGDGGSNDPESVVVSFYEAGADVDSAEQALDAVEEFFHTESPLLGFYEAAAANESEDSSFTAQSVETVETEIVEENLDAEQLNEEYSLQSFYNVSDELLEQLAEENARVSADVTYAEAEDDSTEFLTVTENGSWVIFT